MPEDSRPSPIQFRSVELAEKIKARVSSFDTSKNSAAKRDIGRYYTLLDAARPTFTRPQALLLCDVLNGTHFEPIEMSLRLLWASFDDAENAYYEKHGVEKAPFVERLSELSEAETLAVIDAVERFWNGTGEGVTVTDVGLCGPPEKRN